MAKSLMPNVQDVAARAMRSVKGGYGEDEDQKRKGQKAKGAKGRAGGAFRTTKEKESARTKAQATEAAADRSNLGRRRR